MLDNHVYNLLSQLVEEHKSLWRIQKEYTSETGDCPECKEFWNKMIPDKEEHIKELTEMLKKHLH